MIDITTTLARRYAQAYYNINSEDLTLAICNNLQRAEHFLRNNRSLVAWLKVPVIPDAVKIASLQSLLIQKFEIAQSISSLITLLVEHKRSYLIGLVLKEIHDIFQERSGIHLFVVSSSHELSADGVSAIEQFLQRKRPGAVLAGHHIDKNLIAGIRMQSNSELWEYSVRKDLRAIELPLNR
ncbi:hypothetical protein Noda2021_01280 [Candidatus Dependentiae bacterium Noda2021]|nr:hypothetical protein Noda2021_01280 [Candidatus Dependentiae bacterium Noda2021]